MLDQDMIQPALHPLKTDRRYVRLLTHAAQVRWPLFGALVANLAFWAAVILAVRGLLS
ncbi:MAG: hypothetical protein JWP92_1771 [Caulobacter sp.]|nr:hypothetical protein [Caulobacter sp.]